MASWIEKAGCSLAKRRYLALAALAYCFAAQNALSQEAEVEADAEQQASADAEQQVNDEDLEEVVVVAPRTFNNMRADIQAAEIDVLDVYNDLNTDPDFDIICRRESTLESNIPQRVCRPRYMDRLESNAYQEYARGNGFFDPTGEVRVYDQRLLEKLRVFATESPALYEALKKYYVLREEYQEAREERFQGGLFGR